MTITLNSTAFDAYLKLLNPSGTQVAYNDDGNGGTTLGDPLLTVTFTAVMPDAFTLAIISSVTWAPAFCRHAARIPTPRLTKPTVSRRRAQ